MRWQRFVSGQHVLDDRDVIHFYLIFYHCQEMIKMIDNCFVKAVRNMIGDVGMAYIDD